MAFSESFFVGICLIEELGALQPEALCSSAMNIFLSSNYVAQLLAGPCVVFIVTVEI